MRFWWFIVLLGTLASGLLLLFLISGEMGIPSFQEPTVVAFALALSILPYIWARAFEGWGLASESSQRIGSVRTTTSPQRGFDLGKREEGVESREETSVQVTEFGR